MPTFRRTLAAALLALPIGLALAAPATASPSPSKPPPIKPERTRSYTVDVTVTPQGDLHVRETIRYDFGTARRHGVERQIPAGVPWKPGWSHVTRLEHVSATGDGKPAGATVGEPGSDRGVTTIRVGDPGRTVTGAHTYVIDYLAKGVVTAGNGGPRLAWNALGTGWRTPVGTATVRITAPGGLTGPVCYAGRAGSHDGCGLARTTHGRVTYTTRHLAAGEGITVSAGLSAAYVQAHPLLVRDAGDEHVPDAVVLVAFLGVLALVLVVTGLVVRRIPRPAHRPGRPGGLGRLFGGGGFYGGGGGGGGGFSGGGGGVGGGCGGGGSW